MRDCWAKLNEERAGAGTGTENKDKISFHNFMNVLYRYSTDISSISMDPFVFWFQLYSGKDKDLPGLASWDHWRVNNLFFHFLSLFFDWGGFQVKVRKAWKFHSPYFCNTRRIHINFGKDKDLPGLAPLTGEQPPLSLFVHFSLKQDFDWGGFQEKPKKAWKFHFLNFWNSWNHEEDILQNVFLFLVCYWHMFFSDDDSNGYPPYLGIMQCQSKLVLAEESCPVLVQIQSVNDSLADSLTQPARAAMRWCCI